MNYNQPIETIKQDLVKQLEAIEEEIPETINPHELKSLYKHLKRIKSALSTVNNKEDFIVSQDTLEDIKETRNFVHESDIEDGSWIYSLNDSSFNELYNFMAYVTGDRTVVDLCDTIALGVAIY